jgi:hypothetical protein
LKIFGRDPAAWLALIAVLVEGGVAWGIDLTDVQQARINAAATLLMGLIVAAVVARDQIIPAAASALGGILQLMVAFGVDVSQEKIATAGAVLTTVLAFWLRTQVTAPIDADGNRVARKTTQGSVIR